jgi:hypothetical protein
MAALQPAEAAHRPRDLALPSGQDRVVTETVYRRLPIDEDMAPIA